MMKKLLIRWLLRRLGFQWIIHSIEQEITDLVMVCFREPKNQKLEIPDMARAIARTILAHTDVKVHIPDGRLSV